MVRAGLGIIGIEFFVIDPQALEMNDAVMIRALTPELILMKFHEKDFPTLKARAAQYHRFFGFRAAFTTAGVGVTGAATSMDLPSPVCTGRWPT